MRQAVPPAVSPPGASPGEPGEAVSFAGRRPIFSTEGMVIVGGTGQCFRQVAARQARQYGVKTR